MSEYKKMLGFYNDIKKNESEPKKENKVVKSIKEEFNISEGPAYEYKKHSK